MFLNVLDRNISYTDTGTGFPIVLLHGYLESSEVWGGFAEKLSAEYRVLCFDLPGHGLSEVYSDTHTMEFMAEIVKESLDILKISKCFMAGHSLGGYVTLAFLERFPELLSGYCLFHSQPLPDTPQALEKRRREIAVVEAGKKALMYPDNVMKMFATSNLQNFQGALQRSKAIASKIPGEGIIAVLKGMMQRPARTGIMEKGLVPCLWILGAMDNYIDHEAIQKKVQLPVNAKVIVLQNSGHMGFVEEQEISLNIVSDFVRSVSQC